MPDNMTVEQRSATMSRIRSEDTRAELTLRRLLHRRGLRFRLHATGLPGRPDIVFVRQRVAVFVDGDFWHGWKFKEWAHKLAPYWRGKIAGNQARDRKRTADLRRLGWTVVRIWEHQIESSAEMCVQRIIRRLNSSSSGE